MHEAVRYLWERFPTVLERFAETPNLEVLRRAGYRAWNLNPQTSERTKADTEMVAAMVLVHFLHVRHGMHQDDLRGVIPHYGQLMFAAGVLSERLSQRRRSRLPRQERGPGLAVRGLCCPVRDEPGVTAGALRDRIEAEGALTYDDDDLELLLDGKSIVVRDLATGKKATIKSPQIRSNLARAREHIARACNS